MYIIAASLVGRAHLASFAIRDGGWFSRPKSLHDFPSEMHPSFAFTYTHLMASQVKCTPLCARIQSLDCFPSEMHPSFALAYTVCEHGVCTMLKQSVSLHYYIINAGTSPHTVCIYNIKSPNGVKCAQSTIYMHSLCTGRCPCVPNQDKYRNTDARMCPHV